jgi:hypothetical protein
MYRTRFSYLGRTISRRWEREAQVNWKESWKRQPKKVRQYFEVLYYACRKRQGNNKDEDVENVEDVDVEDEDEYEEETEQIPPLPPQNTAAPENLEEDPEDPIQVFINNYMPEFGHIISLIDNGTFPVL